MNTHMGNISIDNEVIAQYAGSVANECFGIVGMAGVNMKEGIVNLLKKDTMTKGIDVTLTPKNRLVIDFHVIVSYGVNIRTVADNLIESVMMRYKHGNSVCVSSQVGCAMGCSFCASTLGGLVRNLSAGEILGQIYEIQKETGERVSFCIS